MSSNFAGTWQLLRLALRRDRILLPAWTLGYLSYTVGGGAAAMVLYNTARAEFDAASAINNMPSLIAIYGRVWDPNSPGAVAMTKPIGFGGIFLAVLAIMILTRHTRTDEEAGRLELIGAQSVGRWAALTAALLLVIGTLAVISVVQVIGLAASGLPLTGVLAFAASVGLVGLCFAAVAAVTAQLTTTPRSANSLAMLGIALAFGLRSSADVLGTATETRWWAWLSPLGWQAQTRAFAGDNFGALLPMIVFSAALSALAFWLSERRDLGAGLLQSRAGRAAGSRWLGSPFALALRLQRGLLVSVAITYVALSFILGSIVSNVQDMLSSKPMAELVQAIGGTSNLVDAFTSFELGFIAFVTANFGVALARRFAVEEQGGRVEPVLSTAVSRRRLFLTYVSVSLLGTLLLQLAVGLGFGISNGMQLADYSGIGGTVEAALAYLPAIWVIVGISALGMAITPGLAVLGWVFAAGTIIIGEFGELLKWPSWVLNASPFSHVPRMPAVDLSWPPLLWLTAIAVALAVAAVVRYDSRDLAAA